ncbi:MAG: hypothetical protein CMF12_06305 [Idiomarina sp.]|nr:hypothetical protein [Idiomarina sp.]
MKAFTLVELIIVLSVSI